MLKKSTRSNSGVVPARMCSFKQKLERKDSRGGGLKGEEKAGGGKRERKQNYKRKQSRAAGKSQVTGDPRLHFRLIQDPEK